MRDNNLLLTDASVAASAFAANAINLDGTPAEGVWVQFHITKVGADADERIEIEIFGKDTDSGWATTDAEIGHVGPPLNPGTAAGSVLIKYVKLQTKLNYVKPRFVLTGTTPSFTIVTAIVSGPDQLATATLA